MGRPKKKTRGRPAKKTKKKATRKKTSSPKKWDIPDLVAGRYVIAAEGLFLKEGEVPGTDSFTGNFREAYIFVSKERSEEIRLSRSEEGQILGGIPSESIPLSKLASNTHKVTIDEHLGVTIEVDLVPKAEGGISFKKAVALARWRYEKKLEDVEADIVFLSKNFKKEFKDLQKDHTKARKVLETIDKRLSKYG